ncbi:ATP-dependent DNA ligase [Granulicella sp. 5B5]|uniref:ATP-dependent DNA ligase n=1 Tax=Granulicella sp. 5B5 TaxID=1617967 RepID=UPI0015F6BECC|nr:ATP-dependent DNA ligase [Granulicella sp. 5B5]QMV18734.1 ATP-dependent DNA ligase [Granulicella sp. 5B5]
MALFAQLATLAETLAAEPGRLKKRAAIAEAVRATQAASGSDDAGLLCLYLAGQPFAEADPRKLSAGGALLSRAVKAVSSATDTELTAAYRRHGDMGAAASDVWPDGIAETLTLAEVEEAFAAMAIARTTASRAALVEGLLRRATALEAKYLLKLMLGDMRIGVKQSLIEEAIAVAAEAELTAIRHAVMLEADLARVVRMAFASTLAQAHMRLFHPLGFMLASPVEIPEEAVERFTGKPLPDAEASDAPRIHAFLEDKFDGMRAQLHCGDPTQPGRVALYSRTREEITESFPELVEALQQALRGRKQPLILDGEILAWDFAAEKALPFARLGQRIGRKRIDSAMRRQVPVVFMAFDILFQGEDLLLALPLHERRARLEQVIAQLGPKAVAPLDADHDTAQGSLFVSANPAAPLQRLRLSPTQRVESAEQIDRAYAEARARANEGVMLKAAKSAYQPGRRGLAWVKLKRELATLDVVITGAEYGHGRRAGLLSDYTFAVRGISATGEPELLNVGKAYSGVTDAEIAELTAWLKAHTLVDRGHFRTVEPLRVLEVAFNNIMRSDRHSSGFALRFPRILRIRDDKPVEEIDTLERVEAIYESQPDKDSTELESASRSEEPSINPDDPSPKLRKSKA